MKKLRIIIFILFLTFGIGVATIFLFPFRESLFENSNTLSNQFFETEESEEYAVYSALLNEMFVKDSVKLLAISDKTLFYSNSHFLQETPLQERVEHKKKYYSAVTEDIIENFEIKYEKSSQVHSNFNLPVKYVLINEDELSKKVLRNKKEIEEDKKNGKYFFQNKYPDAGGLIRISKVGFNKEKTQAFVEVEFTHCGLCGEGNYVFLEKEKGIWKIKETYQTWVS